MRNTMYSARLLVRLTALGVFLGTVFATGCGQAGARARLAHDNLKLREENARLERTVGQLGGEMASLRQQITNLKGYSPGRPVDLFAPVTIDIVSLSGGADFDDHPGDDGVVVYLRPRDVDGHPVKVPGRIRLQLTDNAVVGSPRVLGVCVFDHPDDLRQTWHSRFGTMHYALRCPFLPEARPRTPRVSIYAEFTDFLTGRTLTATKEVAIKVVDHPATPHDSADADR